MNESGAIEKKHRRAIYNTCVINMMCAGACECDRTPFPSRSDFL